MTTDRTGRPLSSSDQAELDLINYENAEAALDPSNVFGAAPVREHADGSLEYGPGVRTSKRGI